MTGPRVATAVLLKDLLIDLRSRDRLGHMAVFSALVVVVMSITLPAVTRETKTWLPALLWVVFLLTSLLGLGRSFQSETDDGALATLALVPCDRGWVFLGKMLANLLALLGVQVWTAMLFAVFLDVTWTGQLPAALGVALLGAIGLSASGTLLSALSASARFREFLLPVLLFPLILPLLVWASRMTAEVLSNSQISVGSWLWLAFYDWLFVLIGYFVFDYVLED